MRFGRSGSNPISRHPTVIAWAVLTATVLVTPVTSGSFRIVLDVVGAVALVTTVALVFASGDRSERRSLAFSLAAIVVGVVLVAVTGSVILLIVFAVLLTLWAFVDARGGPKGGRVP